MNNPHHHKGRVWDIFPCDVRCDGQGNTEVEMTQSWLNGWPFHVVSFLIVNFLVYVCRIEQPGFKITFNHNHK